MAGHPLLDTPAAWGASCPPGHPWRYPVCHHGGPPSSMISLSTVSVTRGQPKSKSNEWKVPDASVFRGTPFLRGGMKSRIIRSSPLTRVWCIRAADAPCLLVA